MKPRVLNLSCPIIGCQSPTIKTFGGISMGQRIDDHLMKQHTIEEIIDYANKQIIGHNYKKMDEWRQRK